MKPHTCGCCKWAGPWQRTPTGRIKKNTVTGCEYRVTWPKLPTATTHTYGFRLPSNGIIWPAWGTDCPCWEPTEAAKEARDA